MKISFSYKWAAAFAVMALSFAACSTGNSSSDSDPVPVSGNSIAITSPAADDSITSTSLAVSGTWSGTDTVSSIEVSFGGAATKATLDQAAKTWTASVSIADTVTKGTKYLVATSYDSKENTVAGDSIQVSYDNTAAPVGHKVTTKVVLSSTITSITSGYLYAYVIVKGSEAPNNFSEPVALSSSTNWTDGISIEVPDVGDGSYSVGAMVFTTKTIEVGSSLYENSDSLSVTVASSDVSVSGSLTLCSADSTLKSLSVTGSTALALTPSFSSSVTEYTVELGFDNGEASIAPVTNNANASFEFDSGDATVSLSRGGSTTVTVTVTAESGRETEYAITFTRTATDTVRNGTWKSPIEYDEDEDGVETEQYTAYTFKDGEATTVSYSRAKGSTDKFTADTETGTYTASEGVLSLTNEYNTTRKVRDLFTSTAFYPEAYKRTSTSATTLAGTWESLHDEGYVTYTFTSKELTWASHLEDGSVETEDDPYSYSVSGNLISVAGVYFTKYDLLESGAYLAFGVPIEDKTLASDGGCIKQ